MYRSSFTKGSRLPVIPLSVIDDNGRQWSISPEYSAEGTTAIIVGATLSQAAESSAVIKFFKPSYRYIDDEVAATRAASELGVGPTVFGVGPNFIIMEKLDYTLLSKLENVNVEFVELGELILSTLQRWHKFELAGYRHDDMHATNVMFGDATPLETPLESPTHTPYLIDFGQSFTWDYDTKLFLRTAFHSFADWVGIIQRARTGRVSHPVLNSGIPMSPANTLLPELADMVRHISKEFFEPLYEPTLTATPESTLTATLEPTQATQATQKQAPMTPHHLCVSA